MNCKTKYPVLLVHGLGLRDDLRIFKYWNTIPEVLRNSCTPVFLARHDAFASIQQNALLLKKRCMELIEQYGFEKLNIIAHSKGGIESRYMISKLDMHPFIASLTTIASPHRGASLANITLELLKRKKLTKTTTRIINGLSKLMGDKFSEVETTWQQLTPAAMEVFNERVPDMPGVYYQSYGSLISENHPDKLQIYKYKRIFDIEGPNDGVVSLHSFRWGNFRDLVVAPNGQGVSHHDIVGLTRKKYFDVNEFFLSMVADLKNKGF